jgi:hypothetical protein
VFGAVPAPKGAATPLAFSGAVCLVFSTNTATASIGDSTGTSANVKSNGYLNVHTFITDVPQTAALSEVDSAKVDASNADSSSLVKETSISPAVIYGTFTNHAYAFIGKNADVNARHAITIFSETTQPYPNFFLDFVTQAQNGGFKSWPTFVRLIYDFLKAHLNGNFGLQQGYFSSWAQSTASGTKVDIAGAVDIMVLTNTSDAYISTRT